MNPVPAIELRPRVRVRPQDIAALVAEAERYLAAVDLFRSEGCELVWLPERAGPGSRRRPARRR